MQTMNNKTEEPNSVDPPEDHLNNRFYRKILNALLTKFNHFKCEQNKNFLYEKTNAVHHFERPLWCNAKTVIRWVWRLIYVLECFYG